MSASFLAAAESRKRAANEMSSEPEELFMCYFPLAGRGELTRLIAAAGGVKLTESTSLPPGDSKPDYLSPSGVPCLKHGEFKMSQSLAIERYVSDIAPKFKGLSAQERAVDSMYGGIKEEMLLNCAKAIFTTKKGEDVTALLDKWFPILEAKVPSNGFINGLAFPTVADLAVLNITTAYMPFGAAMKLAGYDQSLSKYPKVKALAGRAAAALSGAFPTKYTEANPLNMP